MGRDWETLRCWISRLVVWGKAEKPRGAGGVGWGWKRTFHLYLLVEFLLINHKIFHFFLIFDYILYNKFVFQLQKQNFVLLDILIFLKQQQKLETAQQEKKMDWGGRGRWVFLMRSIWRRVRRWQCSWVWSLSFRWREIWGIISKWSKTWRLGPQGTGQKIWTSPFQRRRVVPEWMVWTSWRKGKNGKLLQRWRGGKGRVGGRRQQVCVPESDGLGLVCNKS